MFAGIAGRYDFLNHLLSLNIDRHWRRFTIRQTPIRGADPILDVCTGTGDLALGYARLAKGSAPVIGTDFCAPMLDIARKKSAAANLDIEWIEADAQALPFEANRFQIVTVAFGLRNVADTAAGIDEMIRVAKPGGRVAILEFSKPTAPGLRQLYLWYFRSVLPRLGQAISKSGDDAYRYLPESVLQFPDGQAMVDLLTARGLTEVRRWPLTLGIATLYIGVKPAEVDSRALSEVAGVGRSLGGDRARLAVKAADSL